MIKIAYTIDDIWVVGLFLDESHIQTQTYLDITNMDVPSSPPETWDYIDGVFSVDSSKLAELNRKNMPTLSPIEFDIKLVDAGLYDQVQSLIQSDVKLKIAYNRATFFSRTDPFIDQACIALGLTDEQVDAMWEQAITL